ncbi:hypothetical protein VTK26DRAFT_7313 [Humicola hyalothermophila]
MFYSHEILTNSQYGVTTVWLVSNIGLRSATRKISRKAIQEVNVQKACETILQPQAPIALRLQGSLLYGLSRVYSQQCHYVLTDAERVQAHMRAFYNALGGSDNALDPQAGKTRRKELILEDDPEFELRIDLPTFHFDDDGNLIGPQGSQASRKTSSQLSPLHPDGSISSSNRSLLGGFDLSHSPFGGDSSLQGDNLKAGTMTPSKGNDELMALGDEERELQAYGDWGIEIDAEGNVIPSVEEPELPLYPPAGEVEAPIAIQQDGFNPIDSQGDVIMGGSENAFQFHSDPPVPPQMLQVQAAEAREEESVQQEEGGGVEDDTSSGQAPVRKRRRVVLAPDAQTKVTRQELRSWATDYLDNAEQARHPRQRVTATEARKNAFNLIFGSGIANIGFPTGVPGLPHPLAHQFAGEGLQARLLGIIIHDTDIEERQERTNGRRRSASEAFELEEDGGERRVRRRLSEDTEEEDQDAQQLPRRDDDALRAPADEDALPPVEMGRRAGSVLPDIPSDVPWNRGSSQIPSSSVKGRAPSRQVSASPLHGRGSILAGPETIERFSDQPMFGSDDVGFAPLLHSGGAGSGGNDPFGSDPILPPSSQQQQQQNRSAGNNTITASSQSMLSALDREGSNFLAYLSAAAQAKGAHLDDGDDGEAGRNRYFWVEFASLFEPEDQKPAIVAQAFYHVLSLATKKVVRVRQDGQGGHEPFGAIHVGVEVVQKAGEQEY